MGSIGTAFSFSSHLVAWLSFCWDIIFARVLRSFLPVCFSDLSLFGGVGRLKIQSRPYRRFPNQGDRPAHVPRFVYRPLFYIACTLSLGTGYLRMLTHARAILLILAPFSSWLLLFMNGLANCVTVQLFRNAYPRANNSLCVAYYASAILRSAACCRRVPPINLVTFIDIRWFQALGLRSESNRLEHFHSCSFFRFAAIHLCSN